MEQLKQMPQLLNNYTSDEDSVDYAQPKSHYAFQVSQRVFPIDIKHGGWKWNS